MNGKHAMRHVEVYTADRYLFQKIRLLAPEGVKVTEGRGSAAEPIRLVDLDTANPPESTEFISMSRKDGADIRIPIPIDALSRIFSEESVENVPLILSEEERCVYLYGEKIRLTEVEYLLMSTLVSAGGEYTSRDELLTGVWGGSADPGVVNVYIHYLREKLEGGGEKIILSSRKCGYKISEKYLLEGGESDAQNN